MSFLCVFALIGSLGLCFARPAAATEASVLNGKTALFAGDSICYGFADTADVVLLLQHLIGAKATNEIMADLNEDARVTIVDAVTSCV